MKKKLFSIVGMVIVALAAWQLWSDVKTLPKDSVATGDVQTTSGPVRGFTQNGLDVFLDHFTKEHVEVVGDLLPLHV